MTIPKEIADWLIGGVGVVLGWLAKLLTDLFRAKPKQ